MRSRTTALVATTLALAACGDAPTGTHAQPRSLATFDQSANPHAAAQTTSSVRWNRKAIALFRARGGNAGRMNSYVSLAQYRAVLAAEDDRHGKTRPSPAGAAAGASVVVLKFFYPLDVASIDADLAAQRDAEPFGTERNKDFAAGEAIGRQIGAAVLAQAATDNFGATPPPPALTGPGHWTSSGAPTVRGGWGARPFFLTSGHEVFPPPPPAFNSPEYLAALAEVRAIALTRTPEQIAIALKWVPFSGVVLNGVASDLIDKYNRPELEAARILAYANTAAFDAIIGCFDAKFTYWFIRPTQADPTISLATALPNHPSYPSAHSCETGAWQEVLKDAFPSERDAIDAIAQEASISRVYGGLHYRFDGEAGVALGRLAARLALSRGGLE
jgi:membrane-associated phospholipid phosphatase